MRSVAYLWCLPAVLSLLIGGCADGAPARGQWLARAWEIYKIHYVTWDGRVVDDSNNNISHSEGQGYAMLIAVRANDKNTFANLWRWTRDNLFVRPDGLAAWRWDPNSTPHVSETNNATDGDLLIAWALAEAGKKWGIFEYSEAARKLADLVAAQLIVQSPFGAVLLPGEFGFGSQDQPDGPVINLSYWVFPAIGRLKSISRSPQWDAVWRNGLALVKAARFGPNRLPSDWISLAGQELKPAEGYPRVFGYDVIRVPLYLAWGAPHKRTLLANFTRIWNKAPYHAPSVINVDTGKAVEPMGDKGYKGIAALLDCILKGRPFPKEAMRVKPERYYPTTLHILSLIAASERRPKCLRH